MYGIDGDKIDQVAFLGIAGAIVGTIIQSNVKMVSKYVKKPVYALAGGAVVANVGSWAYQWAMTKKTAAPATA